MSSQSGTAASTSGGVQGSVKVGSLSAGAHVATLPSSGLTVVGVIFDGPYIIIPIDSSRSAILPNTQNVDATGNVYPFRRINFTVSGQQLNFTTITGTATVIFYYGTPMSDSLPLTSFLAATGTVSMTSGTAAVTLTFPEGKIKLTGVTAIDNTDADNITLNWSTGTGQSLTLLFLTPMVKNYRDIVPLDLEGAQSLTIQVTTDESSSDSVIVIVYYAA